jgi:two-component system copper resistance phosphate regulon response regulator CusR
MRLLLIEDDPGIAEVVQQGLSEAGFEIDLAADGIAGFRQAIEATYELVILDLMLPGMDGLKICEELRLRRDTTPILMLTARDSVQDRVRGLENGADDYLPKPFDFDELLARVRALLRRDKIHKRRLIRISNLEIDTGNRSVKRNNLPISLSPREYTLLEALAVREGQTLTREIILDRVWLDDDSYSNTVDVYIGTLRKKIDAGHDEKLIHTVHGQGYVLRGNHTEEDL